MKIRPREPDHVHLDALDGKVVEQRSDQLFRGLVLIESAVDEVDADEPERLLLLDVFAIQHPNMDDNVVGFRPRMGLETDPHPAMRFAGSIVRAGRDRVCEDEEARLAAALIVEALDEQLVLILEHRDQPLLADVALTRTVNRIRKRHVVGRHRLRHRAARAAHVEKLSRHLLARANLGERAVPQGVQVDLESLFIHGWLGVVGLHTAHAKERRHPTRAIKTDKGAGLPPGVDLS